MNPIHPSASTADVRAPEAAKLDVSVVIPYYGEPDDTVRLIGQLRAQQNVRLEIIVSDDVSPVPFPTLDDVRVVRRDVNGGFGRAVNSGAQLAQAPQLLILNSDLEVGPTFVRDLVAAAELHQPCIAGCVMRSPDGDAAFTARRFPQLWHYLVEWLTPLARFSSTTAWHRGVGHDVAARPSVTKETDWVVGAVMLLPTSAFRDVGGFDERFFMNCEEVDLQRRLREVGVPAWFLGDVECQHEGGGSSDPTKRLGWLLEGRFRYAEKWNGRRGKLALGYGLIAASYVNYAVNVVRAKRNSEVFPKEFLSSQVSVVRERMKQ